MPASFFVFIQPRLHFRIKKKENFIACIIYSHELKGLPLCKAVSLSAS